MNFSYDVVFNQPPDELLRKFKEFNARIVFGAETFCWPDPALAVMTRTNIFIRIIFCSAFQLREFYFKNEYPDVSDNEYRFLNSGGFIGYAPDIYTIISNAKILDNDDDQLFYTKIFFNKELRVR